MSGRASLTTHRSPGSAIQEVTSVLCIFIYGPPASGKLTVARALSARTGWPVHRNHLGVDAALSLFSFGSDGFCRLRERFWLAAFEEAARASQSFVFTFAPEQTVRPGVVDELALVVTRASGSVVFVELTCALAERERRLALPERSKLGKLTSLEQHRELDAAGAFEFAGMPSPIVLLATDELSPTQSARQIQQALRARGHADGVSRRV